MALYSRTIRAGFAQDQVAISDSKFRIPNGFQQKQSHQVIENTKERPGIGQNKANLAHTPREEESKPRVAS